MSERAGWNVVLIVLDSLRQDAVGCYGRPPPWGPDFPPISTPNLDRFAGQAIRFDRAYPESLPTLCARRSLYTGQRTFPFRGGQFRLRGDFVPAPGWGPIPEDQHTLAETLAEAGVRTGLVSDLYHQFKPSKNFWRGFDEWHFVRGQEVDTARIGPNPSEAEIARVVPEEVRTMPRALDNPEHPPMTRAEVDRSCGHMVRNMQERRTEDQWFNAQVMQTAARWLDQNYDARHLGQRVFLTVESFDPHEPWFVPPQYREAYDPGPDRDQVISVYSDVSSLPTDLIRRTRANYAGLVTMVDRWFGHLLESLRTGGWLEDTVVIVTSDHGHSLAERGYLGKRGYPADPEVMETALLIRLPGGRSGGTVCDAWVQHHDLAATVLDAAGVAPRRELSGRSLWPILHGAPTGGRDHVVIGWGSAMTVVTERWWLNVKVDGSGPLLHDRTAAGDSLRSNVAADHPEVVARLTALGLNEADRHGGIPDYLLEDAALVSDAPGCSPLATGR